MKLQHILGATFLATSLLFEETLHSQCNGNDTNAPQLIAEPEIVSMDSSYPQPAVEVVDASPYTVSAETTVGFSTIDSLYTPALGANLCNYLTSSGLMFMGYPTTYRYWKVQEGVFETFTDGTVHFTATFFNTDHPNGQLHANIYLEDGQNWEDWIDDTSPHDFKADCEGIDAQHINWMYYLVSSESTITGTGDFEGTVLNISHAPANHVYGYQVGLGSNNYSAEEGSGGWLLINGVFTDNATGQTFNANIISGDFMFKHILAGYRAIVNTTYTATDACGNTSVFHQEVELAENPGPILSNMPMAGTYMDLCDLLSWQPEWHSFCEGEVITTYDALPADQITETPSPTVITVVGTNACGVSSTYSFEIWLSSNGPCAEIVACAGDFNHDGFVTTQDVSLFIGSYYTASDQFDINEDAQVNTMDLIEVLVNFGSMCGE